MLARLSRDGYVTRAHVGARVQAFIITGRQLAPSGLLAIGNPPSVTP